MTQAPPSQEPERAEIRDLGFRPYVGERRPAVHNGWVMFRYGLLRTWSSLVVKLALLLAVGPALVAMVAFAVMGYVAAQSGGQIPPPDMAVYARRLTSIQMWCFMTTVAVGAATGSIADDRLRGAFTFYFTKPLTQRQYVAGRAGAVALVLALVLAVPCSAFVLVAAALESADSLLPALRVLAASWAMGIVGAIAVTALALAVSSLGLSPALSAFGFLTLWVVPWVGSGLARVASEAWWLDLLSMPSLVVTFASPLFADGGEVSLAHGGIAFGILLVLSAGAFFFAHDRVVRASELS